VLAAWGVLAHAKVLLHLAPQDMRQRGLGDPLLVVSDGAPGLIRAIEECFPRSLRQRCLVHKLRNLQSKVSEDHWPEFKARAIARYQAASPALARTLRDLVATYGAAPPSALACFRSRTDARSAPPTGSSGCAVDSSAVLPKSSDQGQRNLSGLAPEAFVQWDITATTLFNGNSSTRGCVGTAAHRRTE
jgi:hypothetical protein